MSATYTVEELAQLFAGAAPTQGSVNPDAHITVDDFDAHTNIELFVTLNASLNDLEEGVIQPIWRAAPGQEHIFQRIAGFDGDVPRYEGDKSKGLLLGAQLRHFQSDFPIDLGVNIPGVVGNTVISQGERYAFVVPKKAPTTTLDKPFFVARSTTTRRMIESYNSTSPDVMRGHVFKNDAGETCIKNTSPLALMMRDNAGELGGMTFGLPEGVEGMLQVDPEIVDVCINAYAEQQRVQFQDMNNFCVKFSRVGEKQWNLADGVVDNLLKGSMNQVEAAHQRLARKNSMSATIALQLVLYGEEGKAKAAAKK